VPLPAAGAAGAAVGAARQMVESAWFKSWSWLGQKVARFRGGGAPVASEDEGETPSQHTAVLFAHVCTTLQAFQIAGRLFAR
jgi:hypothetical protein